MAIAATFLVNPNYSNVFLIGLAIIWSHAACRPTSDPCNVERDTTIDSKPTNRTTKSYCELKQRVEGIQINANEMLTELRKTVSRDNGYISIFNYTSPSSDCFGSATDVEVYYYNQLYMVKMHLGKFKRRAILQNITTMKRLVGSAMCSISIDRQGVNVTECSSNEPSTEFLDKHLDTYTHSYQTAIDIMSDCVSISTALYQYYSGFCQE